MKLIPVSFDPFVKAKVPKASVSYSRGMKLSHCGICEFYSNRACSKVAGEIDPAYWCRLFVRKRKGFAEGGAPEMTAPFPEAPGGYPFFTADSASDTPSGVLPSELPPVDVPPAERGPIAGFLDQLAAPSKYAMEPDLQQTQTGATEGPKGVAPQNLGINDAGQYVDMGTGEPIQEEPQTRRPNVLPITMDPSGKPELAMPKVLDVASNIIGGNVPGGAGTILGSGFARAAKDIAPIPNELGFYSATQHAIETAPQAKASPQQWMGMLRNAPGVKQEEMKWLGLEDWLKDQKGPVSKEQVADFVKANNIEIKEVGKGGYANDFDSVSKRGRDNPDILRLQLNDVAKQIGMPENSPWIEQQLDAVRSGDHRITTNVAKTLREYGGTDQTKFSSYTLPGGQNYRELLLTLPTTAAKSSPEEINNLAKTLYETYERKGGDPPWERLAPDLQEIYRSRAQEKSYLAENPNMFRSSHWDEPNVLAHIRFNDRVIDGKKTLFVEEVQSDWHQAGKRRGYKGSAPESEPTGKWEVTQTNPDGTRIPYSAFDTQAEAEAWAERVRGAHREATVAPEMTRPHANETGVPDAPFKTTWPELSMKRVLKYAADNGYEKVAWTPGDVQAARYDLSKHVDRIGYTDRGDGTYNISASRGDLGIFEEDRVDAKRLQELVGKDMAEKITKGEGRTYDTYQNHVTRELTGLDLKVGGEGMRGFYDQILPATVNKLVKKYGAKVEKSKLNPGRSSKTGSGDLVDDESPVHSVSITPQMQKAVKEQGFPQFSTGGSVKHRLTPVAHNPFEAHSAARRAMYGHKHT